MLSTAILRASSQHRVCLPQFIVAGAVLLGPPPSSVCATRCWVECGRASGANGKRRQPIHAPPVFILVCKNTAIAKVLYEWLAEDKRPQTLPPANIEGFKVCCTTTMYRRTR